MIGKRLTKFSEENNLTIYNEIAYGYYNDYLMTLNQVNHTISVSFAVRIYDTPHGRKYSELLCDPKNKVAWSVSDIVFTDCYLQIFFYDTGNTVEKMKNCIDTVTSMMKEDNIVANNVCTVCGDPIDPQNAEIYLCENKAMIMNHSCVEKHNAELSKKKRKYNSLRYRTLVMLKRRRKVDLPKKIIKLK